jgi:hypothetical protein
LGASITHTWRSLGASEIPWLGALNPNLDGLKLKPGTLSV